MEKEQGFKFTAPAIRASMATQVKLVNQCMDRARTVLVGGGLPADAVKIKIHAKNLGVVRDIARESRLDYDAVVVGRKGYSKFKDILVGSVPEKLLGRIRGVPLIVVGGVPVYRKILVAFDGTREIINAVKMVGSLISCDNSKILLNHVIKAGTEQNEDEKARLDKLFNETLDNLKEKGFGEEQIGCEVITDEKNATHGIIAKAQQEDYNTIVVGRRALTFMNKIFFGRVGTKIFQMAENLTVWVVQ